MLGYEASAVGSYDLTAGVEFLLQNKEAKNLYLSANLIEKETGRTVFPPYRVIERNGKDIALVGVTGRSAKVKDRYSYISTTKSLRKTLSELNNISTIILLSTLSYVENKSIAKKFPEIKYIISADPKRSRIEPSIINNTLIAQANDLGKYIEHLVIDNFDKKYFLSGIEKEIEKKTRQVQSVEQQYISLAEKTSPLSSKEIATKDSLKNLLLANEQNIAKLNTFKQTLKTQNNLIDYSRQKYRLDNTVLKDDVIYSLLHD